MPKSLVSTEDLSAYRLNIKVIKKSFYGDALSANTNGKQIIIIFGIKNLKDVLIATIKLN